MYAYHCHNTKHVGLPLGTANIMATLRILVFRDVLLVGRFAVFKLANQRNNNAMETSNFAVSPFLI
jgi:hypothetical protein